MLEIICVKKLDKNYYFYQIINIFIFHIPYLTFMSLYDVMNSVAAFYEFDVM